MKVKFFTTTRADRQLALLLFAGTLGLYLRTVAPGLLFGDSGEFQVAAWTLGLAHPTGYPLYLLLGSLWQHLLALFGLTPAYTLNVLSALFGALTVATLYLVLMQWLTSSLAVRRLVALLAALLFAVNPTFWSQSLIAEVYTLHTLFVVLLVHLAYQLLLFSTPAAGATSRGEAWGLAGQMGILLGLALTHHAMTLLLLPSLFIALWRSRQAWATPARLGTLLLATIVPLLLYLYIPLRSGPSPSPWYHQQLGTEPLTLYQNDLRGFWHFLSGQSIAVGFRDLADATAQLPQAWLLWRLHFLLPGLALVSLGVYVLWHQRNWRVIMVTVPFVLCQQGFNLFYAIDDILAYYIPLYLIAAIWAAFAVDTIAGGLATIEHESTQEAHAADERERTEPSGDWRQRSRAKEKRPPALAMSIVLVLALFWLPFQLGRAYYPQLDQSTANGARRMWDAIVAAAPGEDAILISNDRNEIVPLFYYQAVEGTLRGVTGLFPLIEPRARFADIGATVTTALTAAGERPVYLIKAMPGLETKFDLQPATLPLIAVQERADMEPDHTVEQPYGPLQLLGFDWEPTDGEVVVKLYWQVNEGLQRDYTTTVQLFDAAGEKIAQHDAPPGGNYYPTPLWKPGEVLVEAHLLETTQPTAATDMLVAMYNSVTLEPLAPPIEIGLTDLP